MSAPAYKPLTQTRDPLVEAMRMDAPIDVSVIESAIKQRFATMDEAYAQIAGLELARKRIYDELQVPYAPLEHA